MSLSAKAADMIESAKTVGWDLGLSSIQALLTELNNPQNNVKAVHVTGTNGKGSICAFLNSILIHAGYKVGRFTSPAVSSEYERYTINDNYILEETYEKCLDVLSFACEKVVQKGFRHPSLFEIETALAYLYFDMADCDIMIIEVGMGGLLDATNVIAQPVICAYASIGLDHMQWLGNSIEEITKIKSGIIKPGCTIVSALQEKACEEILLDCAKANMANIVFANRLPSDTNLGLIGHFQYQNAGVAVECALVLRQNGFSISDSDISNGLRLAKWPYRFEKLLNKPSIYLDGAHNYPAILELKETLKSLDNQDFTFVISVLSDKSYDEMFKAILPLAQNVIIVESVNQRALDINSLYSAVEPYASSKPYKACSFDDAAKIATDIVGDGSIVCFGTFTFLYDIKKAFMELLEI